MAKSSGTKYLGLALGIIGLVTMALLLIIGGVIGFNNQTIIDDEYDDDDDDDDDDDTDSNVEMNALLGDILEGGAFFGLGVLVLGVALSFMADTKMKGLIVAVCIVILFLLVINLILSIVLGFVNMRINKIQNKDDIDDDDMKSLEKLEKFYSFFRNPVLFNIYSITGGGMGFACNGFLLGSALFGVILVNVLKRDPC